MANVIRFVRLQMIEGTSSKFHEQYVMSSGNVFLHKAVWGRIGTPGTTQKDWPRPQDHYGSAEEALAVLDKLQHEKLKKGYSLVSTDAGAAIAARQALVAAKDVPKPTKKRGAPAAPAAEDDAPEHKKKKTPAPKKAKAEAADEKEPPAAKKKKAPAAKKAADSEDDASPPPKKKKAAPKKAKKAAAPAAKKKKAAA